MTDLPVRAACEHGRFEAHGVWPFRCVAALGQFARLEWDETWWKVSVGSADLGLFKPEVFRD